MAPSVGLLYILAYYIGSVCIKVAIPIESVRTTSSNFRSLHACIHGDQIVDPINLNLPHTCIQMYMHSI